MIKIQYLGQNGFRIDVSNDSLCFDLYLSDCVYKLTGSGSRNYDAPVLAETLTDIDYYFISHDHLDPDTIKVMSKNPDTIFICPNPYVGMLEELGVRKVKIIGAKAYEEIQFENFQVIPIPEKHENYAFVNGDHVYLGYVVCADTFQFYHAGDAIADKKLADDLKKLGRYDVMFLPINGHDWKRFDHGIMGNMNYREALDLSDYVGTDLVVPMHYDLFDNNTENPSYFVDYLYRKYPKQKFKMFMPGETIFMQEGNEYV